MIMHTAERETANTKEQFKQKMGCFRATNKRQDPEHRSNIMQMIQLNQMLLLIQCSQVTITMRIASFLSHQTKILIVSFQS